MQREATRHAYFEVSGYSNQLLKRVNYYEVLHMSRIELRFLYLFYFIIIIYKYVDNTLTYADQAVYNNKTFFYNTTKLNKKSILVFELVGILNIVDKVWMFINLIYVLE